MKGSGLTIVNITMEKKFIQVENIFFDLKMGQAILANIAWVRNREKAA
jgi:hypothetical protein